MSLGQCYRSRSDTCNVTKYICEIVLLDICILLRLGEAPEQLQLYIGEIVFLQTRRLQTVCNCQPINVIVREGIPSLENLDDVWNK
jgi:hypothetical protein